MADNARQDDTSSLLLQLEQQRAQLANLLHKTLRSALFSSRAFLRPADVHPLATSEVDAFLAYLRDPDVKAAQAHGSRLATIGVSEEAILREFEVFRRFCAQNVAGKQASMLFERLEERLRYMLQSYVQTREAIILLEQERIRAALQHTLHRYTLQLETAAEVAHTAISTLDLDALLTTTVELIEQRLSPNYVAIYLLDQDNRCAELRAAAGPESRNSLATSHHIDGTNNSTVARCLSSGQHVVDLVGSAVKADAAASQFKETQSEIALPLVTHGKVIGVLHVRSPHAGAFLSQDIVGFQIMSNQLASAIENARLYASAQQRAHNLELAYDQLKDLEILKDQFMQNVSHELRTPLTMIRGYTELLLDEDGPFNGEQREALEVILRNAQALTELVSDIMVMLEANAARQGLTAVSYVETVRDSVASFQYLAQQKDLTLELSLPDDGASCQVMARQDHLRRITDNLIANAIKFTPPGGQINARIWRDDDHLCLEVADTGIGIPQHLLERVFERFFQVDSSQRRLYGGVGLGLALVKELVEGYSGSVRAFSPGPDQGSTFTVLLPCLAN